MASMASNVASIIDVGLGNNLDPHPRNKTNDRRRNAKEWFLTIWSRSGLTFSEFHGKAMTLNGIERYVLQEEKCPESGKIHLQVYLKCSIQQRLVPELERLWGLGWYRPCASSRQAIKYCTKLKSCVRGPLAWDISGNTDWAITDGEFVSEAVKKAEKKYTYGDTKLDREISYASAAEKSMKTAHKLMSESIPAEAYVRRPCESSGLDTSDCPHCKALWDLAPNIAKLPLPYEPSITGV